MQSHQVVTLFQEDGTEVQAQPYFSNPTRKLASGLISAEGRVIRCEDYERGVFWFGDTQEKLYRDKPESTLG